MKMLKKIQCWLWHGPWKYLYTDYGMHDYFVVKCELCDR